MCRLLHLKIISLKNPLQIGLCNKADWIDKNFQASIVGNFNLFNLEHTLISGIELEDYDYKSFIIRSKDHFDLDINHPYKPQTLPELNNITTHDREQLKAKLYLFRIRFI